MKILFIVFNDYLAPNGISVVTQYIAEGLVKKNHDVKVFTAVRKVPKPAECNGVRIEQFKIKYNRLKQPRGEVERLRKMVKEENCDVLVLVSLQTPTSDCLLSVFDDISAKKVLYTHDFEGLYLTPLKWKGDAYHTIGNSWNYLIWKRYYSYFVPRIINKFDMTVSLTTINKDWEYLSKYYNGKKIIISNAAEDMFFDYEDGSEFEINEDYFVSVANYNHVKNQKFILKEYYKTKASKEHAMVFCGASMNHYTTKMMSLKRKLDKRYGSRKVYFFHDVERNKIPALIKKARLYLCGSQWEAFSISLIESMALGVPFVSLNVGNAQELPGGITVFRKKMFSDVIDELCVDETRLLKYSNDGIEFAKKYCRKDIAVDKFEHAIKEICQEN